MTEAAEIELPFKISIFEVVGEDDECPLEPGVYWAMEHIEDDPEEADVPVFGPFDTEEELKTSINEIIGKVLGEDFNVEHVEIEDARDTTSA